MVAESETSTNATAVQTAVNETTIQQPLHFMQSTNVDPDPCNNQWLLLWSFAAYMPEKPNKQEIMDAQVFYGFFEDQCRTGPAAGSLQRAIKESPPEFSDRNSLCKWLTFIENKVRSDAKVPPKAFRYKALMERWRYADGYM